MAEDALPGNPFARDLRNRAHDRPLSEEALATLALAFEVRTANILEAAKPLAVDARADQSEIVAKLQEAGERLGYSGTVKRDGEVVQ